MIAELEKLLPPPPRPVECPPTGGWERVEREFGSLPNDYMNFIDRYGTGFVGEGYITIFNPFALDRYLNLLEQATIVRIAFKQLAAELPDRYGMPFYPNTGGYLPFGVNMDGAYLLWMTAGDPEDWTVSVIGSRTHRIHEFSTGMVDWLCDMVSGRRRCIFFADDFPGDGVAFDHR